MPIIFCKQNTADGLDCQHFLLLQKNNFLGSNTSPLTFPIKPALSNDTTLTKLFFFSSDTFNSPVVKDDFGYGVYIFYTFCMLLFYLLALLSSFTNLFLIGCASKYFMKKSQSSPVDVKGLHGQYCSLKEALSACLLVTFSFHTITGEIVILELVFNRTILLVTFSHTYYFFHFL